MEVKQKSKKEFKKQEVLSSLSIVLVLRHVRLHTFCAVKDFMHNAVETSNYN